MPNSHILRDSKTSVHFFLHSFLVMRISFDPVLNIFPEDSGSTNTNKPIRWRTDLTIESTTGMAFNLNTVVLVDNLYV